MKKLKLFLTFYASNFDIVEVVYCLWFVESILQFIAFSL